MVYIMIKYFHRINKEGIMELVRSYLGSLTNRRLISEGGLFVFFIATALVCSKLSGYSMFLSSTLLCIVVGMAAGNTFLKEAEASTVQRFVGKTCLDLGVILLGAKLNFIEILGFGSSVILFVILIGLTNVVISMVTGKIMGLSKTQSAILGVGGMSCIVPAGEAVGSTKEEVGTAIGAIKFSETIFLFILPTLAAAMNFTHMESAGVFTGVFHIMGYLVASSSSISQEVLNYAVVIKMARLLTFAPIVMILGMVFKKNSGEMAAAKTKVPPFIKGFIITSLVFTGISWLSPGNPVVLDTINHSSTTSTFLINAAMVAIGMKINVKSLLKRAPKVIICVGLTALIQMMIALGAAKILF